MTKEERYSILRPLTVEEQEVFAVKMCNFFAPWNYDKNCECITISSTVRPGNSGGPVVSLNGCIIGIVTQFANSASSVSADKEDFKDDPAIPFYNAVSAIAIKEILLELDNTLELLFEDYN